MSNRRQLLHAPLLLLAAAVVVSCGNKSHSEAAFVGTWVSSRTNTPIHILQDGVWEIRSATGEVLQGGGWELKSGNFVWAIRLNDKTMLDPNRIVHLQDNSFELREHNGSVTKFRRLAQ